MYNHKIHKIHKMKTILFTFCLTISLFSLKGQNICEDALLSSLTINSTGELADYQVNCCPPTTPLTAVQMTDSAGVTEAWYNNNYVFLRTNSLAYFTMGPWDTQMVPSAQGLLIKIPRTVTEDVSGTKNTAESGTIGLAVDGVSIFSETTSQSYNNSDGTHISGDGVWNEDAWVDESWSLDSSGNGHTNATGKYHYHASPIKLYSAITAGHSPIVGWGLDGVPIYGPYGYSDSLSASSAVVRMETGYQLRNITDRTTLADGTVLSSGNYGPTVAAYALGTYVEDYEHVVGVGHLDDHNGRWCVTPEYPSGVYAYFITEDAAGTPAFPYFIGPEFYGETASGNSIPGNASQFDPTGCTVTSVKNSVLGNSFSFFPNPSSNGITLDLASLNGESFHVNIMSMHGQLVHSEVVYKEVNQNISFQLKPGFYQLQLVSGEEVFSEVLVVK